MITVPESSSMDHKHSSWQLYHPPQPLRCELSYSRIVTDNQHKHTNLSLTYNITLVNIFSRNTNSTSGNNIEEHAYFMKCRLHFFVMSFHYFAVC